MKIVVVESPAKAKTINKYLGKDYKVFASFGHIRDLPPRDGSVRPENNFEMDWETDPRSEKHIKEIAQAVKGSQGLILATDPDREGEAISWHVRNVLVERKIIKNIPVKRVVFNEITKTAILEAMKNPRELDQELVDAYLARRALDYLVGFTLSPVLWRKLPGSKSAGRVQSVALRLICERESEIEQFKSEEYWTIDSEFKTQEQAKLTAQLHSIRGTKLGKFDLPNQETVLKTEDLINRLDYHVSKVERKDTKRHPYAPFTTSTLQQEASRKLYFSASHTMRIAQKLYEGVDIGGETVGLITYMRTDGIQIAHEAIIAARQLIEELYGPAYVPKSPRIFKNKSKNAQEAHEAIRPTDLKRHPQSLASYLDRDQLRLYELIWLRTIACQMESATLDQVSIDIASTYHEGQPEILFRATGSVIKFKGFLILYKEDQDDTHDDEQERLLPDVKVGENLSRIATLSHQHFTQPPPRFSEASLVKRMEELGIGRPSTYASILTVLQERDYVRIDSRRFIPEDRGRVVTAFLENFFMRYVQYNFTADLENQLDDVASGKAAWKKVLESFWKDFSAAIEDTKELRITEVIDKLDESLSRHFFPQSENGENVRLCPLCHNGKMGLRLGKFGAFIGCSNYPDCKSTRPLSLEISKEGGLETSPLEEGLKILGSDPETQLSVSLKKGPYGYYIQLGEALDKKDKPKRVSLMRGMDPSTVDLTKALKLLSLPRFIGSHPETGEAITASVGKFGAYLKYGTLFKSLEKDDDVLEIGMNRAVELLSQAKQKQTGEILGHHPDGQPIFFAKGRYGPYVSHNKVNANIPRGTETITFEEALALITAKSAKKPTSSRTTKKTTVKKKTQNSRSPRTSSAS